MYSFAATLLAIIIMLAIGVYCLVMIIEDTPIRKR